MDQKSKEIEGRDCWFVGASYGGSEDQTPRFIQEGIWENGYQDKYLDSVKSIRVGDRIAIKSSYTRKHGLPFDNRGQAVSVMAIKAIGRVTENFGDGRRLKVAWAPVDPQREWYFYTSRSTIWRVLPGEWPTDGLITFTFEQKAQDIDRFRNAPYWRERFGDKPTVRERFEWTKFYMAIADKLLTFKHKRGVLVAGIHQIAAKVECPSQLQDQFADGTTGPLQDICPFTTMGIFNRGITEDNRKAFATELAKLLGVSEPVPNSFEGIPLLNNQKSWFFNFASKRQGDDIDALWEIFAQAIAFSDSGDTDTKSAFAAAYDNASQRWGVGWNLTMGLYWARPWSFATLDMKTQHYIKRKLNIPIEKNSPKGRSNANDYVELLGSLETRFQEDAFPVHSFPELSFAAWHYDEDVTLNNLDTDDPDSLDAEAENVPTYVRPPVETYSVDDIITDGCFLPKERIVQILDCLRNKKNLILQGPPGTGKTWLAKRLAYALVGQRDDGKVRAVQFHPNLSYEDFVRGWRPSGAGRLELLDGPLIEMITAALQDPSMKHVLVIEEINRGNPAQILGEMLTLLEADKRTPNEAVELAYRRASDERVHIPANLYVIGTMNIADRSLALVDLALRRRFGFIDLEPAFGQAWRNWVQAKCRIDSQILAEIERRLIALNDEIAMDKGLGPQFRIGHSFVTPPFDVPVKDAYYWFKQVVETEIGPLLDEYWFDAPERARDARNTLLQGL